MLFNRFQFAYFFLIVFTAYWFLPRPIYRFSRRAEGLIKRSRMPRPRLTSWLLAFLTESPLRIQNIMLLVASYYFYACWNPKFLTLLVLSTVMDYCCALAVDAFERPRSRKWCVAASMMLNLGMLGYFKYCNFFADSLQMMLARMGWDVPIWHLENVILPIGISFYTFQSMSYVIDVYRHDFKPTRNLIDFAAFVSFFPHLVAGPIMRPTTLLPQIQNPRRFDIDQFYAGGYLIFWGLVKKVVVADNLAAIVNDLFGRWQTIDGGLALLAIYAFAFHIYCDFSGYTDAARGIAKMMGFELTLNFNLPYCATSPKDFWARWHISLSSWLRDYLYIPLGGNRGASAPLVWKALFAACGGTLMWYVFATGGTASTALSGPMRAGMLAASIVLWAFVVLPARGDMALYRNLMLTMVIGGFWHGASWTFIVWGAYQGLLLIGHRLVSPYLAKLEPRAPIERACWTGLRIFVTFHLVCIGWLIFRAETLAQVQGMLSAIVWHPTVPVAATLVPIIVCIVPLFVYQYAQYATRDLDVVSRTPWYVRSAFYTVCFYAYVLGGNFGGGQFIYFQF